MMHDSDKFGVVTETEDVGNLLLLFGWSWLCALVVMIDDCVVEEVWYGILGLKGFTVTCRDTCHTLP